LSASLIPAGFFRPGTKTEAKEEPLEDFDPGSDCIECNFQILRQAFDRQRAADAGRQKQGSASMSSIRLI
jgi:hypothetical protein